jgi:hypothetical protein
MVLGTAQCPKPNLHCLTAAFPRLVKHVDDSFLAAVTRLYKELIPPEGEVLDLMSSWVSHLPADRAYKRVVGHGMNAVEVRPPQLSVPLSAAPKTCLPCTLLLFLSLAVSSGHILTFVSKELRSADL